MANEGYVVWLTGLSGAGKTTIAGAVVAELRASGERLAAELAEADPSLDQTVTWCFEFGVSDQSRSQRGDPRGRGRNNSGPSGAGI